LTVSSDCRRAAARCASVALPCEQQCSRSLTSCTTLMELQAMEQLAAADPAVAMDVTLTAAAPDAVKLETTTTAAAATADYQTQDLSSQHAEYALQTLARQAAAPQHLQHQQQQYATMATYAPRATVPSFTAAGSAVNPFVEAARHAATRKSTASPDTAAAAAATLTNSSPAAAVSGAPTPTTATTAGGEDSDAPPSNSSPSKPAAAAAKRKRPDLFVHTSLNGIAAAKARAAAASAAAAAQAGLAAGLESMGVTVQAAAAAAAQQQQQRRTATTGTTTSTSSSSGDTAAPASEKQAGAHIVHEVNTPVLQERISLHMQLILNIMSHAGGKTLLAKDVWLHHDRHFVGAVPCSAGATPEQAAAQREAALTAA
jgi:hypothetical protein